MTLADELYGHWFVHGPEGVEPWQLGGSPSAHLSQLAAAHHSRGAFEPGWTFRRVAASGHVEVEKYGVVFRAPAADIRPENPLPGAPCRVRVPAQIRGLQPGFWSTVGETDPRDPSAAPGLLRIYWHLLPVAAPRLVQLLSTKLDECGIPFRLKLVANPKHYRRADAGVLYLDPRDWAAARPVAESVYADLRHAMRPQVPRLTSPLAPGLGLSEGAADGASFGSERCALIAKALVMAWASGRPGPKARQEETREDAVARAFRASGLDPCHPYRAPGSASSYPPMAPLAQRPPAKASSERSPEELAVKIGEALCAQAFHHEGQCNWLRREKWPAALPASAGAEAIFRRASALGTDLYGGTSGISIFLAELFAATGDEKYRHVAHAACQHALARPSSGSQAAAFYEGRLGTIWAARRVAALTADLDLERRAHGDLEFVVTSLVKPLAASARASSMGPEKRSPDIISGSAGGILALLSLSRSGPYREGMEARLLESAAHLGGELLHGVDQAHAPLLCGFGHGAAGLGLALLELGVAFDAEDFRQAAERLFRDEDESFDPRLGGWPDWRPDSALPDGGPPGCMVAWCHGAAGIALARLRAMAVDPSRASRYESTARLGLAATYDRVERLLRPRGLPRPGSQLPDLGLCHGLAGLLEVITLGAEMLGDERCEDIGALGREALLRASEYGLDVADPSLFNGAAGVGYTLLRLARPDEIPSLLLPAAPPARDQEPPPMGRA